MLLNVLTFCTHRIMPFGWLYYNSDDLLSFEGRGLLLQFSQFNSLSSTCLLLLLFCALNAKWTTSGLFADTFLSPLIPSRIAPIITSLETSNTSQQFPRKPQCHSSLFCCLCQVSLELTLDSSRFELLKMTLHSCTAYAQDLHSSCY